MIKYSPNVKKKMEHLQRMQNVPHISPN